MLFFGVLPLLLVAVSAQHCYNAIGGLCALNGPNDTGAKNAKVKHDAPTEHVGDISGCTAVYAGFTDNSIKIGLQSFAHANIEASFHSLMMSSYFGTYKVNREGFKKLYRQYSDKLWEDAIHVMKYIAKRGGEMDFTQSSHLEYDKETALKEIQSLAAALDIQKELAKKAFQIYFAALTTVSINETQSTHKDPAIAHFIEERFLESHTERIRELAGYLHELKDLSLTKGHTFVNLFLFDEYLKKSL